MKKQMFKSKSLYNISKMKKIIFLFFILFFTGCSSINNNIGLEVTDENVIDISIRNSQFNPDDIVIGKGTKVIWTNYDSQGHTITSENYFDSNTIQKGETFSFVFNEIGEFEYNCKIHPEMIGTIIVH